MKALMVWLFFIFFYRCFKLLLLRNDLNSQLLSQNKIGADIIMALDDVVKTTITGPRIEEAMYRTLRWIDRCIAGKVDYICCFYWCSFANMNFYA